MFIWWQKKKEKMKEKNKSPLKLNYCSTEYTHTTSTKKSRWDVSIIALENVVWMWNNVEHVVFSLMRVYTTDFILK